MEVPLRSPRALVAVVLPLLGLFGACSEWPRYNHLPAEGDLYPATQDPRTLFDVQWSAATEADPNDSPLDVVDATLAMGQGTQITGQITGTGWYDDATAAPIEHPDCSGSVGTRSPLGTGDYIGDVDFFAFEVTEPGLLCARLLTDPPTFGWDLVLFPVDSCNIPGAPISADGVVLGVDQGGAEGGWGTPIEAPGTYVVMAAAYYPNNLEAVVDYELGVALVHPDPDGGSILCPVLPTEEAG